VQVAALLHVALGRDASKLRPKVHQVAADPYRSGDSGSDSDGGGGAPPVAVPVAKTTDQAAVLAVRAAGQAPHVDASRGECVTPQPPRELALRRGSALSWMRWTTRAATDCGVTNSYAYATGDGAVQQRTRGGKAEAATPRSVSKRAGAQQVRLCAVSAIAFICSQARARP
jgi:hypothetical protein